LFFGVAQMPKPVCPLSILRADPKLMVCCLESDCMLWVPLNNSCALKNFLLSLQYCEDPPPENKEVC